MFSGTSAPAFELVEAVFLPSRCASPALLPLAPLFFTDGPGSAVQTAPFHCATCPATAPTGGFPRMLRRWLLQSRGTTCWREAGTAVRWLPTLKSYRRTSVKTQFIKHIFLFISFVYHEKNNNNKKKFVYFFCLFHFAHKWATYAAWQSKNFVSFSWTSLSHMPWGCKVSKINCDTHERAR